MNTEMENAFQQLFDSMAEAEVKTEVYDNFYNLVKVWNQKRRDISKEINELYEKFVR